MIVLVGETRDRKYLETMRRHGWGRIWVRLSPRQYEGEPWAFDNGAYGYFLAGKDLDETAFLKRLDVATKRCEPPMMAVLPDLVGRGEPSLSYSEKWLRRLEDHPWKNWYWAAQDRQTHQEIGCAIAGIPLNEVVNNQHIKANIHPSIKGIFLGGSDKFKHRADSYCWWAHFVGLKFHYGRASTPGKIRAARRVGADSMDTAFPLWTRERFQRFVEMWSLPDPQQELGLQ